MTLNDEQLQYFEAIAAGSSACSPLPLPEHHSNLVFYAKCDFCGFLFSSYEPVRTDKQADRQTDGQNR